ncbi:F-box/kelch-repeat protein At3g23880-like [Papaver somniferum]|uniref:F-box/kelch-repeat protein At3g23880-like n=1 Tax=Papaver somniferum TaxID=3469 RepID=UPI000E705371|nr:F-box/kelch-repeat protein At3g23880-like [Papaver somniferum]
MVAAAAAAFSSLPEEIQSEILVKLPAKSVLTCKCVCKLWLNLISCPRFINDHLHLSIQNKKNHKLMFTDKESVTGKPLLYSIDHASISSSPDLSCDYIAEKVVLIDYPFEYKEGMEIRILGACNGLICFGILMDTNTSICIWNPTTREYREIQHCDFHINPKQVSRAGFGFDAKTGDYKMVRIGDYEKSDCCKVEVYTFGLHLSKTVLTFAYMYPHEIALRGVFLNGALHWIGSMFSQVNSDCIVSFDVSNEKLMDVALPCIVHPKDGNSKSFKQVGVLDECLSLVLIDEKMVRAEVWTSRRANISLVGKHYSWPKLFIEGA